MSLLVGAAASPRSAIQFHGRNTLMNYDCYPRGHGLRKGRVSLPNNVYHITTTTVSRRPIFTDLYIAREVVKCIHHPQRNTATMAYVIMPDHMHWLMQLGEEVELSREVGDVKSISTRMINRLQGERGSIWQSGFHDHAVRQDEELRRVARYIIANPLRAGLVKDIGRYSLWDAVWL